MRRLLIVLLLLMIPLYACGGNETTMEFEQSIEIFDDASVIDYYIQKAKDEGFAYYSFIDIRGYEDESDGYPKTKSYCYGYIDYFDNAPWKGSFEKELNKYVKKPKSYPLIIIDYDGSYINECIEFLKGKGFTNIKAFQNGFYDTENNYIDQKGFDTLQKCEDCGC